MKWWKRPVGEYNITDSVLRDGADVLSHITLAMLSVVKGDKATLNVLRMMFDYDNDNEIKSIISNLNKDEKRKAELETVILAMTIVTHISLVKGVPFEILDKYHSRFLANLVVLEFLKEEEIDDFLDLRCDRGEEYQKSLNNQNGAGPLWHFGKDATENIFGDKCKGIRTIMSVSHGIGLKFIFNGDVVVKAVDEYGLAKS